MWYYGYKENHECLPRGHPRRQGATTGQGDANGLKWTSRTRLQVKDQPIIRFLSVLQKANTFAMNWFRLAYWSMERSPFTFLPTVLISSAFYPFVFYTFIFSVTNLDLFWPLHSETKFFRRTVFKKSSVKIIRLLIILNVISLIQLIQLYS